MTLPLPFSWPYLLIFWSVYLWVFSPEMRIVKRARAGAPSVEDRGSLRVVLWGGGIGILAAMLLSFVVPWATLPGDRRVWFFLGVLTMVGGSVLRRHCFRVLGAFFTGAVTIQTDHRVVDSGAYRWVRHPSYTAALLLLLGIGLALGNWLSVVVCLAIAIPAYDYRARIEEQALLSSLGEPYGRFMKTRKRYLPFVY